MELKSLAIFMLLLETLMATLSFKEFEIHHWNMRVCQLTNSKQNEFIGMWVKQGSNDVRFGIFQTPNGIPTAAGYMVEGYDGGYADDSNNYKAPQDGTFMWFGIVMSYSSTEKNCLVEAIFHDSSLSSQASITVSGFSYYRESFKVLDAISGGGPHYTKGSGSDSSYRVYMLKNTFDVNPSYYTDSKALLAYRFVVEGDQSSLSSDEYSQAKYMNMMKYGRSNEFYGYRRSFRTYIYAIHSYGRYGAISSPSSSLLTADDLIRWRVDHPDKVGYKMSSGYYYLVDDDARINSGKLVAFHVYGLSQLAVLGNELTVWLFTNYRVDGSIWVAELKTEVKIRNSATNGIEAIIILYDKGGAVCKKTVYVPTGYRVDIGTGTLLTLRNPLVVIIAHSWRTKDIVSAGTATIDQYQSIVRFTNRPWTPPDNYLGTIPGKSYGLFYDSASYQVNQDIWKMNSMVTEFSIDANTVDFDVRIAELNMISGVVRRFEYVQTTDLIDVDYNKNCIGQLDGELGTDWENTHGSCQGFYFDFFDMLTAVPYCRFNPVWNSESCEFCDWTSTPSYYNDASGGQLNSDQSSGTQCRTEAQCTGQATFITTPEIQAASSTFEATKMKSTCVDCPTQCDTCQWNFVNHKLECLTCIGGYSRLIGGQCVPPIANCLYSKVTTCDLCQPDFILHIKDNDVRYCQTTIDSGCIELTIEKYRDVFYPYLNENWRYRICHNCQDRNLAAGLYFAIEDSQVQTWKCLPMTTQIKGMGYFTANRYFDICPVNCRYCKMTDPTNKCIECISPKIINGNTGTCMDASSCVGSSRIINVLYDKPEWTYYPRTSPTCLDCTAVANCKDCNSTTTCQVCNLGFLISPAGLCQACPNNCTNCTSTTSCQNCTYSPSEIFHPTKNVCQTCGPLTSSFVNPADTYCKDCFPFCQNCTSQNDCQECQPGHWLLLFPLNCVSPCPDGMSNHSLTCKDCPANCKNCDLTNLRAPICISCFDGFNKNESGNCIDCTQGGFVLNLQGICTKCPAGCLKCTNDTIKCTECKYPLLLANNLSCIEHCQAPAVIYRSLMHCVDCEVPNCQQCETDKRCQTCSTSYKLLSNKSCDLVLFEATYAEYDRKTGILTVGFGTDKMLPLAAGLANATVTDLQGDEGSAALVLESSVVKQTNSSMIDFKLTTNKNLQKAKISLVFNDTTKVVSEKSGASLAGRLDPRNQTITVEPVQLNWPPAKSASTQAAAGGVAVVTAITTVLSFNSAVILIKIYQMMGFMLLYNVNAPANFMAFISIFASMDPTEMLPDIFTSLYVDECSPLGEKFKQQQMSCQFIQNSSLTVTIGLIMIVLTCFVRLLRWLLKSVKSPRLNKILDYLLNGPLGQQGLFNFLLMWDIDIFISATTNNKYYAGDKESSMNSILNNLLSATLVYGYPLLILFYFLKTRQLVYHQEARSLLADNEVKKWGFLIKGRKEEGNWYTKYCEVLGLLRNFLISAAVVCYYDSPYAQLLICLGLLVSTCVLNIMYRPYNDRMENITSIMAFLLYSMCTVLFIASLAAGPGMNYSKFNNYLGWPMIVTFSLLVATNMLPPLLLTLYRLFNSVRKCCNKKTQKNKTKSDNDTSRITRTPLVYDQQSSSLSQVEVIGTNKIQNKDIPLQSESKAEPQPSSKNTAPRKRLHTRKRIAQQSDNASKHNNDKPAPGTRKVLRDAL